MSLEIVAYVWEYPCSDIVEASSQIIELWTSNRQEDEYHVVYEERGKYDKRGQFKLGISLEEIEYAYHSNKRIV